MKLGDMSPALQDRVRRALAAQGVSRVGRKAENAGKATCSFKKRPSAGASNGPNATEQAYNVQFLGGNGVYEAVTLRLPGGSRYTADWADWTESGTLRLHEVKGAYRFPSEGRAWTAFREACAAFPRIDFVWAKRTKSGEWEFK